MNEIFSKTGRAITPKIVHPIFFLLALSILPIGTGCSIIGFAVGSGRDAHAHDSILVQQVSTLHPGDDIHLVTVEGEPIEGTFIRLENIPVVQADSNQYHGPQISFLSRASGVRRTGQLAGFEDDTLWIHMEGTHELSPFSITRVEDIIDEHHRNINPDSMKVIADNLPPLFHKLLDVSVGDTVRKVPVDKTRQIRYNKGQSSRWLWLAIGGAVDAAVVGIGIALSSSFPHSR